MEPINEENKDPLEVEVEDNTIQEMDESFKEARGYREKFEKDWEEFERFYDGKHYKGYDPKPKHNLIFQMVESEVPILTDSRPGTSVIADEEENADKATVLEEALKYVYDYNAIDLKISQAVRSSLKTGNSYLYVDYDEEAQGGRGQVVIKVLPWRYIYLDPSSSSFQEMTYCHVRQPVKIDFLKTQFPEYADKIEEESIDLSAISNDDLYRNEEKYTPSLEGKKSQSFMPDDMAYLHEWWRKDYTMKPIDDVETANVIEEEWASIQNGRVPDIRLYMNHGAIIQGLHQKMTEAMSQIPDALEAIQSGQQIDVLASVLDSSIGIHKVKLEENPEGLEPKYKNFWRLTIKINNNQVYDGETPVPISMIPISPVYSYKDEDIYGFGEVKNTIEIQKMYNDLTYSEYKGARLNLNSGWVIDSNSNVDETTLTNDEGLIIQKKQGTEVRRLEPGQISPQIGMLKESYRMMVKEVSGINEATEGGKPQGVTAARAIEALQNQSIGRIRLKSRMLEEYTMLRLGWIVSAYIIHYWSEARILRIYDDNGRIQSLEYNPDDMSDLSYSVKMSPGSTIGISKEAILTLAKELLQMQVIDAETFLTMTGNIIPYKNVILQKLQERDQMRQQLEAMSQQLQQLQGAVPAQPGQPQAPGMQGPQQLPQ
jgi:hypothetical protein